ncbi:MAG: NepR family anti-sigma factor [Shimia sp.]
MSQKPPRSSVVEEIDQNLKQAFDTVANEPIPDRLRDLLAQLKEQGNQRTTQEEGDADD